MLERFTAQARSVTILAREEALRVGDPAVASRHVLLGILAVPSGAGALVLHDLGITLDGARAEVQRSFRRGRTGFAPDEVDALQTLGIDLEEVRRTVEETFGAGALERSGGRGSAGAPTRRLPFTPGARKVLALAVREAVRLGQRSIGTEHLLLGLVRDERCSGARVLATAGVRPGEVREAVQRVIESGGDPPGRTA